MSASLSADLKNHFADEVLLAAGVHNPLLHAALASVPREAFMGPGPWHVAVPGFPSPADYRFVPTADADVRWLYHNVALALDASRSLVTALPSSVATCLDDLQLRPGARVLHVGAGVGYYTALIAAMAGPGGQVVATEVDPALGERARQNLASQPQVRLHIGADLPAIEGPLDAIFINAGVTHLEPAWLDLLAPGGRLLAPLTVPIDAHVSAGLWALVQREEGGPEAGFTLRTAGAAMGYSALGLRKPGMEVVLRHAMSSGRILQARRIRRDAHDPATGCVLHCPGACLSS